jgi:acetyl-CoA C-acetyltransferase
LDSVAATEGNWSYADPARALSAALGSPEARTVRVDIGVPQQTPVSDALRRIRSGASDVVMVVGGEAMASRLVAERAGGVAPADSTLSGFDGEPDERWQAAGEFMAPAEIAAGIWKPVEQYACIDVARAATAGWSAAEHDADIAALWSAFDAVAAANPLADFAGERPPSFFATPSPTNRPLASPYNKWHVTQWSVDQAAALLLCSAAAAEEAGVPRDRWVFPRVALESSTSVSLSRRADVDRWPAMGVLGSAAAVHLGRPLTDVEFVECYSCFPVAVRVQQAELGLPVDGVPTVTGGMPFAGGPFNSFTFQATAAVVERLRTAPDALGMVTTVSGLLTKPGLMIWGASPGPDELVADLGEEAAAATGTLESTDDASGTATVVTGTATYQGMDRVGGFVLADLADGRRWIGATTDPALLDAIEARSAVGQPVQVLGRECVA